MGNSIPAGARPAGMTILVPEASSSELDHLCSKQTAWMRADLGTQPEEAGPQGELRGELAPQPPQRPIKPLLCIAPQPLTHHSMSAQ